MQKTKASFQTAIERRQDIEQICLRLLARREHSRRELLEKLALRGFSQDEAIPVIEEIAAQNWQNDERFAEAFVQQRIASGYGPLRIRYELQQRGITVVDLDVLAAEAVGGWLESLLALYQRKYAVEQTVSQAEWLKRSRFMQQRGFSGDMIKQLHTALKIKLSR